MHQHSHSTSHINIHIKSSRKQKNICYKIGAFNQIKNTFFRNGCSEYCKNMPFYQQSFFVRSYIMYIMQLTVELLSHLVSHSALSIFTTHAYEIMNFLFAFVAWLAALLSVPLISGSGQKRPSSIRLDLKQLIRYTNLKINLIVDTSLKDGDFEKALLGLYPAADILRLKPHPDVNIR